jgi:hypothetical protein
VSRKGVAINSDSLVVLDGPRRVEYVHQWDTRTGQHWYTARESVLEKRDGVRTYWLVDGWEKDYGSRVAALAVCETIKARIVAETFGAPSRPSTRGTVKTP